MFLLGHWTNALSCMGVMTTVVSVKWLSGIERSIVEETTEASKAVLVITTVAYLSQVRGEGR